jgi:hypothetical protein
MAPKKNLVLQAINDQSFNSGPNYLAMKRKINDGIKTPVF